MSERKVSEILDEAASLIEPKGTWTQQAWARKAGGRLTCSTSDDATCWCIQGAIGRVIGTGALSSSTMRAVEVLRTFGDLGGVSADVWNDAEGRTQAEAVAKLREAAAKAREQGL